MGLFKRNIDSNMDNSGSRSKPFLFVGKETDTRSIFNLVWLRKYTEKRIDLNLRGENDPYFVKTYELKTKRIFGLLVKDREQSWKYDNF